MSYIGSTPTTQSFISGTDYFNGTGSQTAFTLSRSVVSVNDIEVVVNNVVQQPNSAYTISGTTITFTSAPSSGTSNIYVRYLSTTTQSITPSQNTVSYSTWNSDLQNKTWGFKNRIINGAMMIDQRNAGASVTITSSTYTIDRWQAIAHQSSKYSVQQNAGSVTTPAGFKSYLGVTSLSAYTVGSTEVFVIRQPIEGFNVADLAWGTASAASVTVSFWVRSSLTGTFGGSINQGSTYSYPFTYTISVQNTWEYKTITIPGSTAGTWNSTNSTGFYINFGLGCGASVSGTAGSWAATDYYSATGATSVVGTNGATFYITGVQLEVGTQATNFDVRSYGTELALCQRYYEKAYDYDVQVPPASSTYAWFTPTNTSAIGSNALHTTIKYSVAKRARPTVTVYPFTTPSNTTRVSDAHNNSDFGANSGAVYIGRVNQVCLYNGSGGSLTLAGGEYGLNFGWSADAEL